MPVTYDDMFEARKRTGPTSSSGLPVRPIGVWARNRPIASGLLRVTSVIGVSMTPGAMAFTLIFGANSLANPLVKTSTAPFEAAYNVIVGAPDRIAADVMFIIDGLSLFSRDGRNRD